jgi:ketosteroid isomerase-like protein
VNNVELLKNLYAAFARGEMPTVLGAMSPDIRWHQAENNPYNPSGDAWVGPEAIVSHLFVRLGAEWDGFDVQPTAFHDAGDTVVVEGRYKGVYKSTGKRMDAQVCHVWDVKDGKIVRFQQYVDTKQLNAVIEAD